MSWFSTDPSLKLRTINLLQTLAASAPGVTVTAGAMAQRMKVAPDAVRPILVSLAHEGYLEPHTVDECEVCGNEDEGLLDEDRSAGEAVCIVCQQRQQHHKLVIFSFGQSLIEVAQRREDPKRESL